MVSKQLNADNRQTQRRNKRAAGAAGGKAQLRACGFPLAYCNEEQRHAFSTRRRWKDKRLSDEALAALTAGAAADFDLHPTPERVCREYIKSSKQHNECDVRVAAVNPRPSRRSTRDTSVSMACGNCGMAQNPASGEVVEGSADLDIVCTELMFGHGECAFGDVCCCGVFPGPVKLFDLLVESGEVRVWWYLLFQGISRPGNAVRRTV